MVHLKCLILIIFPCSLWGQINNLKTFSGKSVGDGTCIFQIKLVDIFPKDSLNSEIQKPKIDGFIDYLRACHKSYSFNKNFKDKQFKMIIPNYLTEVSYELGDQKFAIVIRDTLNDKAISFYYDLDNSYKNHFLNKDSLGFWKLGTVDLNGKKIYRFINWDKSNAGTIFTSNYLNVSYFTKSAQYEIELQKAISQFQW